MASAKVYTSREPETIETVSFSVHKLGAHIGAVVSGVRTALLEHKVLLFRDPGPPRRRRADRVRPPARGADHRVLNIYSAHRSLVTDEAYLYWLNGRSVQSCHGHLG